MEPKLPWFWKAGAIKRPPPWRAIVEDGRLAASIRNGHEPVCVPGRGFGERALVEQR